MRYQSINNQELDEVLKMCLRNKFANYKPETAFMPFHTRLIGKDRMALYSFIHSLNTSFGTSIFEPVAKALGTIRYEHADNQQIAGTKISTSAQKVIQEIMDSLTTSKTTPDKAAEIQAIRKVCTKGSMVSVKPTKVDLKLVSDSGEIFLIDIKTAKPNIGAFKEFKRTLLEWIATTLADNPDASVNSLIAIPYNPYEPKPYERWTIHGMLDQKSELLVADEFWDFLGGDGAYASLLDSFERVGIELRHEIDKYFSSFK